MQILSPAFGKVIHIGEYENLHHIAIFLSIFDNHVQFAPTKGVVIDKSYKEGEFNMAHLFEKSNLNERLDTTFSTSCGIIVVRQIAGLVARTIRSYVDINQEVKQGQPIGKILFGSRVDLFTSISKTILNPDIHIGSRVYGGKTVLAQKII